MFIFKDTKTNLYIFNQLKQEDVESLEDDKFYNLNVVHKLTGKEINNILLYTENRNDSGVSKFII